MSKTTTLLLVVTLFAAVAVNSVNSAAADAFSFTNGSFYKEKGAEKLLSTGDASFADTASGQQLIAGPNSKSYYYVYQTNTPADSDPLKAAKGGATTLNVRKVDVNKLAFVEKFSATPVTSFKWSPYSNFQYGASVKNNITALAVLALDPSVDNIVYNIYAYLIDLDKNEKTELLVASGSYTDEETATTVSIEHIHISGALTVILYSSTATTASSTTITYRLVTLKGGKLGEPTTVKVITYTTSATENFEDADGSGENLYIVFQTTVNSVNTETVYAYTVSEKEIKAGATTVINTNVADTAVYTYVQIFGHAEGRWVAQYRNTTKAGTPEVTTTNHLVKASNDTTFKILASTVPVDKATTTYSFQKYFGGVIAFINEGTTSSGGENIDQYTRSYQTFGGDFTAGTKTAYLTASGKYSGSNVLISRLGDNKAINVLARQSYPDSSTPPKTIIEGAYFGQLFQKSFGATLQSVLAVCSLMLAALFVF